MKRILISVLLSIVLYVPSLQAQSKGDYVPGETVVCAFPTQDETGVPTTLGGSPVISVYKGTDDTQSTAGITLSVDDDSRTGFNRVAIDTSADGTFYATDNDFFAVITTGTVDGISVTNRIPCEFSLNNRGMMWPKNVAHSNYLFTIESTTSASRPGRTGLTNITCRINKDAGGWATTNDTTETEVGGSGNGRGAYLLDLTKEEMNANEILIECVSASSGTSVWREKITTQH